jgi:hypothetical protein
VNHPSVRGLMVLSVIGPVACTYDPNGHFMSCFASNCRPLNCSIGGILSTCDLLGIQLIRDTQKSTHMIRRILVMTNDSNLSWARTLSLIVLILFSICGTCWPGPAGSKLIPSFPRASVMEATLFSPSQEGGSVTSYPRLLASPRKCPIPALTASTFLVVR